MAWDLEAFMRLRKEGLTVGGAAKVMGLSRQTVHRHLNKLGMPKNRVGRVKGSRPKRSLERDRAIIDAHKDGPPNLRDLAKKHGISYGRICYLVRQLKENGKI